MKILTTLTVSGGLNMASNAQDAFTIGTPLEHNDGQVDSLTVYANADFKNNVILGSSSVDTVTVNAQLTASNIKAASISASGISDFETATFNNVVITAGNIDGTVIGDNYQNTGRFTTITSDFGAFISGGLTLENSSSLPIGSVGMLAVSASNLYYHNGSNWSQIN